MEAVLDEHGCISPDVPIDVVIEQLINNNVRAPILDLRGIPCSHLPKSIAKVSGLQELYLDENGLTSLPEEIGQIEELKVLSLGRNDIRALPASIVERWATLEKLFLGANQIATLSFEEEDLWAFQQGSIGTNPLPEPIGRCWMVRKDAEAIPEIMNHFVPPRISPRFAKLFADQFIHILCQASEPMIFEILFAGMLIQDDGQIHWSVHFDRPWLHYVAVALLPHITRGSIVDPSLWKRNLRRIKLTDLPAIPVEIQHVSEQIILL